jgi:hypothetical protein
MALNGETVIEKTALQDCEGELYSLVNTLPDPARLNEITVYYTRYFFGCING